MYNTNMQSLQFKLVLLCHCFPGGLLNLLRLGVSKPNST